MGDIFWYFKNEKAGFEFLYGVLGDAGGTGVEASVANRKGREKLCEQRAHIIS